MPKTLLVQRPRHLRASDSLRQMVRETHLSPAHFILPLFVRPGRQQKRAIASMPGQYQWSIDQMLNVADQAWSLGIKAVLLFGIPEKKDALGSDAYRSTGIVQQAVRALKKRIPEMVVITDLCFCEYTSHGHCGVLSRSKNKTVDVDNDATLKLIEKTAVIQAKAGADLVAPSGMMDGAVAAIRSALDKAGYQQTGILAYSAKFASSFYGPFRDAAESTPQFGDRKTYQMDPANNREALREIDRDVQEGADMVMVKPALCYLDVMARIRPALKIPLVAYNVSGEYSMLKAASAQGWLQEQKTMLEILTSIKRAGADLIITYHAIEAARLLA